MADYLLTCLDADPSPAAERQTDAMGKRFWNFTFERESYWLVLLYVLLPLLAILLSIIIPGLWHRFS